MMELWLQPVIIRTSSVMLIVGNYIQESGEIMKTGDCKIVRECVNNLWPDLAKKFIEKCISNYEKTVIFRTSTGKPVISTIEDTFQLVINYNTARKCYIVWNAAIQSHLHLSERQARNY